MAASSSLSRYAAALGQRGGRSTSERKKQAARENGKKGGRPRKVVIREDIERAKS
jgi:hypothetical protein